MVTLGCRNDGSWLNSSNSCALLSLPNSRQCRTLYSGGEVHDKKENLSATLPSHDTAHNGTGASILEGHTGGACSASGIAGKGFVSDGWG